MDSGVKMWTMINKLKGMERETCLYDGEGVVIEETKTVEEMLKYWDKIYRKRENKMKCEWDGDESEEYKRRWHHMMDTHGSMVIEYNNMQIYKNIPAHLMINIKLEEMWMWKMWKRSDGMFVVQYNRGREKQTFNCKMEEHMDKLSGNTNKTEVMYPMPKIVLDVDDVRRALGKVKKGKQPGPDKLIKGGDL